jgi:Nuclease-related domain
MEKRSANRNREERRVATKAGGSALDEATLKRRQAAKLLDAADKYERGAEGEQITATFMETLGPNYTAIHDLGIPGSRANVDHVVVGPTGIFVVDSKNHSGRISYNKGTLWSGTNPQSRQLEALRFESEYVATLLGRPVVTIMCFVKGKLAKDPMLVDGIQIVSLKSLREAIRSGPPTLSEAEARAAISLLRAPVQKLAKKVGPVTRQTGSTAIPTPTYDHVPTLLTIASKPHGRKPVTQQRGLVKVAAVAAILSTLALLATKGQPKNATTPNGVPSTTAPHAAAPPASEAFPTTPTMAP